MDTGGRGAALTVAVPLPGQRGCPSLASSRGR